MDMALKICIHLKEDTNAEWMTSFAGGGLNFLKQTDVKFSQFIFRYVISEFHLKCFISFNMDYFFCYDWMIKRIFFYILEPQR